MAEQQDHPAREQELRRRADQRAQKAADRVFAVLWFALRHNITAEEAEKAMPSGWLGTDQPAA